MKDKLMTFLLTIVLIILIIGVTLFGIVIYKELMGEETSDSVYEFIGNITEEPKEEKNKTLEISSQNISSGTENQLSQNSNADQSSNTKQSNSNNINRFFYSQLEDEEKIIYDKLVESKSYLKQGNYVVNFGSTFSDILETDEGYAKIKKYYQTAIEAFTHDNPDVFYIDVNKMYINVEKRTKLLRTTYSVYISAAADSTYLSNDFQNEEEINEAEKQIEAEKQKILGNIGDNDYKKILKIHDYIVDNAEYDSTYEKKGTYSIYGALVGKSCVCEGYAKALKYLANAVGIECEIVQGTAINNSGKSESHAWNAVKINDTWYLVDATWDDPIFSGNGYKTNQFKYKYFLKGTNTFDKDHFVSNQFSEGGKEFKYPAFNIKDY